MTIKIENNKLGYDGHFTDVLYYCTTIQEDGTLYLTIQFPTEKNSTGVSFGISNKDCIQVYHT